MNYRKDAEFERQVRAKLEREGWLVIRSAGSRTVADLVALRKNQLPVLIQCKRDGIINVLEVERLKDLARRDGCVPRLAFRDRGRVRFKDW